MPIIGTQTTTASGLQTSIDTYYDSLLIAILDPATRFLQFAERRPLPQGTGKVVVWNRVTRLGVPYALVEGNPISAVKQLSTTNVSATIQQFGDALNISDLVQLVGIFDARKEATMRLAVQAAEALDTIIKFAVLDAPGGTRINGEVANYIKGSTSGYFTNSVDVVATASDPRLQASDVRRVATYLRGLNVPAYDGTDFVGVIHPNVEEDIFSDSKFENYHQYTTPDNIYSGELGRLWGVRFVRSTLAPISAGSSNGIAISVAGVSTLAYGTVIFGKGFYGATELDGGVKTYLTEGADKMDPLNQTTILGWKANFVSRVLNPSCGVVAWAASGDTMTGASSTSARRSAGLNVNDYPTAW